MKNLKFRMPLYYNGKFKEWHYWGFLNDDEFGFRFESPHSDYRNCPSDQFTGVYDDCDNEIYEGDIILFIFKYDYGTPLTGYIQFLDGMFVVSTKYTSSSLNSASHIKIIGNTIQNPELLK